MPAFQSLSAQGKRQLFIYLYPFKDSPFPLKMTGRKAEGIVTLLPVPKWPLIPLSYWASPLLPIQQKIENPYRSSSKRRTPERTYPFWRQHRKARWSPLKKRLPYSSEGVFFLTVHGARSLLPLGALRIPQGPGPSPSADSTHQGRLGKYASGPRHRHP